MLILSICSIIGLIPNLLYYRDGVLRQSLGTIYPLTFGGSLFFGCSSFVMANDNTKKNLFKEIIVLFICFLVTFKINAARNDSIFIILLLIVSLLVYFIKDKINKRIVLILIPIVYFITIFSIFITKVFPYYSRTYFYLNQICSGRLDMQSQLFNMYTPKMLGQTIPQVGLGGSQGIVTNYFYIDNSYAKYLFIYGILATLLLFYLLSNLLSNLLQDKLYKQAYVVLIIMMAGISEDALVNMSIDVILYVLFVSAEGWKDSFNRN
jgi:hypothetical protein